MEVEEVEQALAENEAAIEAIAPAMSRRKITFECFIGIDSAGQEVWRKFTYIQAPLGFFPSQEFQTMLTRIAKDTLQGKYGINIGELLSRGGQIRASMPSEINEDSINEIIGGENLKVIEAFLELIELVPDLMMDCIALSLGVHREEREKFKQRISAPPHKGGLTINQGVDLVKVFIRQNGGPIRRFLESQIKEIGEEIARAIENPKESQKGAAIDGGTPSNTSSAPIPESE